MVLERRLVTGRGRLGCFVNGIQVESCNKWQSDCEDAAAKPSCACHHVTARPHGSCRSRALGTALGLVTSRLRVGVAERAGRVVCGVRDSFSGDKADDGGVFWSTSFEPSCPAAHCTRVPMTHAGMPHGKWDGGLSRRSH